MPEKNQPLFTDAFLDELASEINAMNGIHPGNGQIEVIEVKEEGSSS